MLIVSASRGRTSGNASSSCACMKALKLGCWLCRRCMSSVRRACSTV
ncbi:hypothetical protein DXU77_13780 [Pseudomonas lactis]|nr:hypothetical protein [Pseudomonas lactis]